MANNITSLDKDQLIRILPKGMKNSITDKMVDTINTIFTDPYEREAYLEDIVSYSSVLQTGKIRIGLYLDAVRFVGFKMKGDTNQLAYIKTFPDRYKHYMNKGLTENELTSHVSHYANAGLVNKILEQSIIPGWIFNQHVYQEAIVRLADSMRSANSERVRMEAANNLINHLKMPEIAKMQLDVNVKEDNSIQELREATLLLAKQQKDMLESGIASAKDIAHTTILPAIEGECTQEDK